MLRGVMKLALRVSDMRERSRAESNRGLRLNRPVQGPSCYGCIWTRPESNRDQGIFSPPLSR